MNDYINYRLDSSTFSMMEDLPMNRGRCRKLLPNFQPNGHLPGLYHMSRLQKPADAHGKCCFVSKIQLHFAIYPNNHYREPSSSSVGDCKDLAAVP